MVFTIDFLKLSLLHQARPVPLVSLGQNMHYILPEKAAVTAEDGLQDIILPMNIFRLDW